MEDKALLYAENQIQDADGSMGSFELPCGYLAEDGEIHRTVVTRSITGVEEDILASKKMDGGAKMSAILVRCTERLGTITDKQKILQIIEEALPVGDRIFLLLAIRRTSLGDVMPVIIQCPACKKKDLVFVDLKDLTLKPMPVPDKRVYDHTLSNGMLVRWSVMTGKTEARISAAPAKSQKSDVVTLNLVARLELLDGKPVSLPQVKGLSLLLRNEIRELFNEFEGGVEMGVEYTCGHCEHEWEEDLDITQQGFFFPSAAQRAWNKKSIS